LLSYLQLNFFTLKWLEEILFFFEWLDKLDEIRLAYNVFRLLFIHQFKLMLEVFNTL